MSFASASPEPAIISLRCLAAEPGVTYDWHEHSFYEFTFVSEDDATIGYPPGLRKLARDTLVFYHCHERHAGQSGSRQRPRFWVVHFSLPDGFLAPFRALQDSSERRVWALRPEQADAFRWMFLQILNERTRPLEHRVNAEAALLRLLLIQVDRWALGDMPAPLTPGSVNPDLMKLWHLVNASVANPAEFQQRIHALPNYDSLRHGFKRVFGTSPREMLLQLRIQHAKNLLLESSLSIKDIAFRCGYQRQHEFARAFRQHTGMSPTAWRADPVAQISSAAT